MWGEYLKNKQEIDRNEAANAIEAYIDRGFAI